MSKGRILFLTALFLPGTAFAAGAPQTFKDLANEIVGLLNSATTDLIVFALVVYFWGISSGLLRGGEKDRTRLRTQIIWGIAVIFVAVSIWGIVQLLQTTVFGNGAASGGGGGSTSSGVNCTSFGDCNLQQ